VLLAKHATTAIVLRRGPSKSVCAIGWDRNGDRFTVGQWLRGRIFELRSDLSPDGKHFIYFAMNGRWRSRVRGSWTAISRAPYLKALALFAKGDAWHGGGLFTSKRTYWLNDGYGHEVIHQTSAVQRDTDHRPSGYYGGECPGVYFLRLERDGWMRKGALEKTKSGSIDVFEKALPYGFLLRKRFHSGPSLPGKGCYWDDHELIAADGKAIDGASWSWAELDGRQLVWAADGCLYRAKLTRDGLGEMRLLADFNEMQFAAIAAPY
jgi:hypothetical protein